MRAAQSIAEKMIKVDHVGENGAVNIYRAQRFAAQIRCRSLIPQPREFQTHEEEHREVFRVHIAGKNIRRCISYHMAGLGGYTLGFITGLMGPNAIAATTYAVEDVVLSHLEHQMTYLAQNDTEAYQAVSQIYEDEKEHHDTAEVQMQEGKFLARVLIRVVKACTEAVIRFGMR